MADPSTFTLSMVGGINTIVDPLQLTPNNLLVCENTIFTKQGQIDKRSGFLPFSKQVQTGSQIINGAALAVFNSELLAFDGTLIYTQMQSTNQWLSRGTAFSVIDNLTNIVRTQTASQNNVDGTCQLDSSGNGIEVYTWEDSRGESRYTVVDALTGAYIQSDQFLFDGQCAPKPIANKSNLNVITIYYKALNTFILSNQIDKTRPNILGSETQVIGDGYHDITAQTGFVFDVVPTYIFGDVIAYNSRTGIKVSYNGNAALVSNTPQKLSAISICNIGTSFYVLYSSVTGDGYGPGVYLIGYDLNTLSIIFPKTLINKSAIANIANTCCVIQHPSFADNLICTYELPETNGNTVTIKIITNTGNVVSNDTVLNIGLASKSFVYGRNAFMNFAYQSPQGYQNTYYTRCLTQANFPVVCKMNDKLGGGYRTNGTLAQCDNTNTGFLFASNRTSAFVSSNGTTFSPKGLSASHFTFSHLNSYNSLVASNNLLITGGILQSYDGDSLVENNFNYYVEFAADYTPAIAHNSGGMADGYYSYQFVLQWTDQDGQTQVSTPSLPIQVHTTFGNSQVQFDIPTLRLSSKVNPRSPISIVAYRTQSNSEIYYQVGQVQNNGLVDLVSFTDALPDSVISGNAPIYTEGQLPNSVPPSCSMICEFGNRVVLAGLEDPNTLWFSQSKYDLSNFNNVPIEFSDQLTIGVTSATGAITAIARLDDKLIIFKENAIYYINGTGPLPAGTGDPFPAPILLVSDTGCDNQNSIVFCPLGLLFKSAKGIYLIDRGTNVSYIGSPVAQYNDLTITSAELLPMTNQVIFTTLEGTVLCWNYYFNQPAGLWYTWTYLPATDSVIWNNQLILIQDTGQVLRQDPNTWIDNKLPYFMKIQTPWLGPLQGYQMMYSCNMLMNLYGPHNINIVVEINYIEGNIIQSESINSNMISNTWGGNLTWGAGTWGNGNQIQYPYQYQIQFSHPMCQSLRMTFSDMQNGNYNPAFSLNSLVFYGMALTGPGRVPEFNKF